MEFAHELPAWLTDILPEPALPAIIKYHDENYFVHYPENGEYPESKISEAFKTIVEAYDSIKIREIDPIFDDSLPELKDKDNRHGMISVESDIGSGFMRALISSTEDDHLKILQYHYSGWRESVDEYLNHPDDFLIAYYFLDGHPCFWTRELNSSNEVRDPFAWKTSGHAMSLWAMPQFSEKNSTGVTFMMEAGSHIAPAYTSKYHDLRLDVYGTSYEDAIIKTAALVHKFFDLEGNERENVEYEKSQLEVDLTISLIAANEAMAEAKVEKSKKELGEF
jgi:hypothetical protein